MKPVAVMDGCVIKLGSNCEHRRVGVDRDKEGDDKLLNLTPRVFITALKMCCCMQTGIIKA
jgi:hypothetical protein